MLKSIFATITFLLFLGSSWNCKRPAEQPESGTAAALNEKILGMLKKVWSEASDLMAVVHTIGGVSASLDPAIRKLPEIWSEAHLNAMYMTGDELATAIKPGESVGNYINRIAGKDLNSELDTLIFNAHGFYGIVKQNRFA